MNPSHDDQSYQQALAARGAFIEYDMIGMDYIFEQGSVTCPTDHESAIGLANLAEAGFLDQLLLSQDVFLKSMLTRLWRQRLRSSFFGIPTSPIGPWFRSERDRSYDDIQYSHFT